jgi:hypothetical protein
LRSLGGQVPEVPLPSVDDKPGSARTAG